MKSISFDRAAGYYDETRGLPPGVPERVASSAAQALPPQARLLEIGVGTGRIAKPLLEKGLRVTGLDISTQMMRRLLGTLPAGSPAPDLLQADAAQIPLLSGTFQAVVAVHVFHLIAGWRQALQEVRHVLVPDGILLTGYGWSPPEDPLARVRRLWADILTAEIDQEEQPGAGDFEEVRRALEDSGASGDEWVAAEWMVEKSPEEYIQSLEAGRYSSTWRVPAERLPELMAELRRRARAELDPLQQSYPAPHRFIWQRFVWK